MVNSSFDFLMTNSSLVKDNAQLFIPNEQLSLNSIKLHVILLNILDTSLMCDLASAFYILEETFDKAIDPRNPPTNHFKLKFGTNNLTVEINEEAEIS